VIHLPKYGNTSTKVRIKNFRTLVDVSCLPAGKTVKSSRPSGSSLPLPFAVDGGIRDGSQALINAAMMAQCVVIAGAQLNRESQSGKADDTFTDADFRGCGDIEQDAHNAIGIGRDKEKTRTYYGLIKARESEISDEYRAIDFKGAYSYMARLEEETFIPNAKIGQGDTAETEARSSDTEEEEDEWAGFPRYQGEWP